jgi:hypothetical protein
VAAVRMDDPDRHFVRDVLRVLLRRNVSRFLVLHVNPNNGVVIHLNAEGYLRLTQR